MKIFKKPTIFNENAVIKFFNIAFELFMLC